MNELPRQSVGHYRWVICALLFFATTVNYVDRAIISFVQPILMEDLHWTDVDYGNVVSWWSLAYALGYGVGGWFMDRVGVKRGFGIAVFVWSMAAFGHGLVQFVPPDAVFGDWLPLASRISGSLLATVPVTVVGFSAARFVLGLAEGGNFPACIKTVSEWFPRKERALATGLFNAGSNAGVIIAPILVPLLALRYGWPSAFFVSGGLSLIWLVAWWLLYDAPEKHPRLSASELAYIQTEPPDPAVHVPWLELLRYRQVWVFVVGMVLCSPIWWFYLYWVPGFLYRKFGVDLLHVGPPLIVIYLLADVGSIGGGWLSGRLIKSGWSVNAGRKTTMLLCAICVVPVFFAAKVPIGHFEVFGFTVPNYWLATLLIALAASAHQGFSANLFTLVSDTAPRKVVSSIVGLGGFAAGIGGMFNAQVVGHVLEWTDSYAPLFAAASCMYLVNLLIMHLINPRLEPMDIAVSDDA
jgi:ACS family hexuronate transporter-like MFS transporter